MATDKLNDVKVRKALPGTKPVKLSDGAGMYVEVQPSGAKYWRLKYRVGGTEKRLSLGTYPEVSLKEARLRRDEARSLLNAGVDPSVARKQTKAVAAEQTLAARLMADGQPPVDSFERIAREWFENNEGVWATSHSEKIIRRLERDVFPWIGAVRASEVTPSSLLTVLRRIEQRGAIETAHRAQQNCSQVFRYAVATQRADSDPSRDLRGALKPWKPEHYPTVTDRRAMGVLLRDLHAYQGGFVVRCALKLSPLLFVRPGELRRAEWDEFDMEAAEWRIPAAKMKGRKVHLVPLARQALATLRELGELTGTGRWVFPGIRSNGEPMSENTVNAALRRLGYDRDTLTAHGFRGMASTTLHEQGWPSDVIERQLSHGERDEVKAAYNHAQHLPERRAMMQAWADYLDGIREGGDDAPATGTSPHVTDHTDSQASCAR